MQKLKLIQCHAFYSIATVIVLQLLKLMLAFVVGFPEQRTTSNVRPCEEGVCGQKDERHMVTDI